MFSFKCKHEWKTKNVQFYEPDKSVTGIKGVGPNQVVEKLLFGYTTISLLCEKCGETKLNTHVGEWKQ